MKNQDKHQRVNQGRNPVKKNMDKFYSSYSHGDTKRVALKKQQKRELREFRKGNWDY